MPTYTVRDPRSNRIVRLTGDSPPTEQELHQVFARLSAESRVESRAEASRRRVLPPGGPAEPTQPSALNALGITVVPDAQWAEMSVGDKAKGLLTAAGYGLSSMMGMGNEGREAVDHPKTTMAASALGAGGRAIAPRIPTRAKAGQKFQQVMGAVKDEPVDIARAGDAALRVQQLAERGGSMPKVVRDFLKRATDPSKGDINYQEARDFYSNISRLSADEYQRLNPAIKKEVGALRVALDQALAKTAARGGQERAYRAAMREYHVASRIRELAETSAKWAAGAAGVAGAYKAGEALMK